MAEQEQTVDQQQEKAREKAEDCLLYTSDAADEL